MIEIMVAYIIGTSLVLRKESSMLSHIVNISISVQNCMRKDFFIMVELTGEGRACIPVGLTKTWDGLVN